MLIKLFKSIFAVAALSLITITASAEDAPVYDVDSYPPQFDGQPDAGTASSQIAPHMPQSMPQSLTMDQRMTRVEQQMTNLQHSDSASKLSALQNEVQSLRGQVEELTHQLQQAQSQQRAMYSDLDRRLNKQPSAAANQSVSTDAADTLKSSSPKKVVAAKPKAKTNLTSSSVPAADEPAADDQPVLSPKLAQPETANAASLSKPEQSANTEQEELQMYQKAYDLIKDSKFDQAIGVLQNMLKKYPGGQSAANAHYWLGELYGLQKKQDQAAVEFATVVKNYPDSPKVSDAQVKLGMIYAAQFKWTEAKATFKKVISHYPGTTSARLAAQQLKEIKAGGR